MTLYLHLTDQTLWSRTGIARLEDIGPVLLDQVNDWLPGTAGHRHTGPRPGQPGAGGRL